MAIQASGTAQSVSIEAARLIARQINGLLKSPSAALEFAVDDESDQVVVRIVDTQTKELIRQIPSEERFSISQSLDKMIRLLLAQKT